MLHFFKLTAIAAAALSLAGCVTFTIEGQARATGDGKGVISIQTDGASGEQSYDVEYTTPPGPEAVYQAEVDKFEEEYKAYNTLDKEWRPSSLVIVTDTPQATAPIPVPVSDAAAEAAQQVTQDQADGTNTPTDLIEATDPTDPIDPVDPLDPCVIDPTAVECGGGPDFCTANPMSPECAVDICMMNPMAPGCGGDMCMIDMMSPECGGGIPMNPCDINPAAPECSGFDPMIR
ncbi:hypothetical protein [Yoonia vestfoldensis]|uniref:hypothetical protein n=1 Tax=Yoonia vestfoldensis TaxID=245188 RepID=UPI0003A32413|nr:hypothetical protein [Yoonia vestfoldensis]